MSALDSKLKKEIDSLPPKEALETAVYRAVGEASMCWSPRPKGVFDSEEAVEISKELLKTIKDLSGDLRQVSSSLDASGLFVEADAVCEVMRRLATTPDEIEALKIPQFDLMGKYDNLDSSTLNPLYLNQEHADAPRPGSPFYNPGHTLQTQMAPSFAQQPGEDVNSYNLRMRGQYQQLQQQYHNLMEPIDVGNRNIGINVNREVATEGTNAPVNWHPDVIMQNSGDF